MLIAGGAGGPKPGWAAAAPVKKRVGLLLELLVRLNTRSFEIANAVMHTSGQAFPMAFQAGGPHAQERGLEALAYAWEAMARTPASAQWTKQEGQGRADRDGDSAGASCRAASR